MPLVRTTAARIARGQRLCEETESALQFLEPLATILPIGGASEQGQKGYEHE